MRRRVTLTHHTLRCPLHDCPASLTVCTDPEGPPSRRHRDVTACSLLSSTSFLPPTRKAWLSEMGPPMPYVYEINRAAVHSAEVACPQPCLRVMNAAEPGAAEPLRCTSGVSDGLELARQTQSPAITRLLWMHSA